MDNENHPLPETCYILTKNKLKIFTDNIALSHKKQFAKHFRGALCTYFR